MTYVELATLILMRPHFIDQCCEENIKVSILCPVVIEVIVIWSCLFMYKKETTTSGAQFFTTYNFFNTLPQIVIFHLHFTSDGFFLVNFLNK